MQFWISLLLISGLLGCLPKPRADNSETKTTVELCYKDFFTTLEGKKISESMRAANEERSGQSLSDFGLNRIGNYLEAFYHTKISDGGLGASRWALLDVFSLYGYAPPWVKWGIPDSLKVTAKKMEKVYNYIRIIKEVSHSPTLPRYSGDRSSIDIPSHVSFIENRLSQIITNRSEIIRLTENDAHALSSPSVAKSIQDLNSKIEEHFEAIESKIFEIKKDPNKLWDRVKKLHLEKESELTLLSKDIPLRLDADEEFLMAVSRFITSPVDRLVRATTSLPLSLAKPTQFIIRGADSSPIEFRSYVYVEGTREPVFDSLHDKGIDMIVFLDGAVDVERQMIFMSKDSALAAAANKSASSLSLSPEDLALLQKWRPDEAQNASPAYSRTLTVLKLDEVAPDRFGPLARGIKEGDECPICMSDLPGLGDQAGAGGITFCPNCCKGFHAKCMLAWAQAKPKFSCPMCRGETNFNSLISK